MIQNIFDNFGIGVDIVDVKQFKNKNYSNNVQFYKKIFTSNEIQYCLKFKEPSPHFAGKFAIKEAVIKSIEEKILPIEIETDYFNSKPVIKLKRLSYKFLVSISHEKNNAVGVVISLKI